MKTDTPASHIHILCCTDSNYLPYTGVMLTSLLSNNRRHDIDIYVATTDNNNENHRRLNILADIFSCRIHIIHINQAEIDALPDAKDSWPKEAYLRLTCLDRLPTNVTKVLYLDGDIIVNTDIGPLWETPMKGKAVAAAPDINNYITDYRHRLNISSQYFNSGVMLMDIVQCRRIAMSRRCIHLISTLTLEYPDQDALNIVLEGQVAYVSQKWNLVDGYLLTRNQGRLPSKIKKLIHAAATTRRSAIIHYTGIYKPWRVGTYMFHPMYAIWHKFYRRSPWHNLDILRHIPANILKRITITRLKTLHIFGLRSSYNDTWTLISRKS